MNYKMIFKIIGNILKLEGILYLLPFVVSLIYNDGFWWIFLICGFVAALIGTLMALPKAKKKSIFSKEGLVIVGLSWIILSLFGCLPFVISKQIPNFVDALFETVSGFTTTGATILTDVESLSKSMLFWRSFTHWVGGMGVLVFMLAIMPESQGQNIFILRAESTGPQVGKLVSKIKVTARILYLIYIGMTIIEMIFLICGGMPLFDSIVNSLATAGTGGFAIYNDGIAHYSYYSQIVIGIFMLLFGINFNIFYLILIRRFSQAFKSEELRTYLAIVILSTLIITLNIYNTLNQTFGIALKDAFFQVSSIITTTGFATVDFNKWPLLSKTILVVLMFIGGCAGSTAGGLKVSRIIILFKNARKEIKRLIHPNSVSNIHFEGSSIDSRVVHEVNGYFALFMVLFAICFLIVSIDGNSDFESSFTAVAACINNIGPGLGKVGPYGNFSFYSPSSKITLIIAMLIGRLEIYPIVVLFSPKTWKKI